MAEKKTIQEAVKEILKLRGKDIFKNIKHFWALLDDLVPECQKERKIIKRTLDEELLEVFIDDSKKVNHRIKILQDNLDDLQVTQDCSDFIIESFGIPLGWSQEIREMKLNRQSSSSVASQSSVNGNANYEDIILDEEGLRKLGITDKKSLTTVNIPATFNTYVGTVYRITKIDDNIFKDCDKLETVVIPDTVTEIGNNAFAGCKSLKCVNIPNAVTKIGNGAFNGCSVLEKVIIPNKVIEIGDEAFKDCEILENVILPDSLKNIGDCAFENCKSFTNIIIPSSATDVSLTAFLGCKKIEQFTIPIKLTAFCLEYEEVTLDEPVFKQLGYEVKYDNYRTDSQRLVYLKKNGKDVTSFDIPATYTYNGKKYKITKIADRTFYNYSSLTSVTITNGVVDLGKCSFASCSSLTSVTIPNGVTSLYNTFGGCKSLKSVNIPNSVINIDYCAFFNCPSLTNIIIPDSVTKIGRAAFEDCSSLTISIPKNCSTGENAFSGCKQVIKRP